MWIGSVQTSGREVQHGCHRCKSNAMAKDQHSCHQPNWYCGRWLHLVWMLRGQTTPPLVIVICTRSQTASEVFSHTKMILGLYNNLCALVVFVYPKQSNLREMKWNLGVRLGAGVLYFLVIGLSAYSNNLSLSHIYFEGRAWCKR